MPHAENPDPLAPQFLDTIDRTLTQFLDSRSDMLAAVGATDLLPVAREAVSGGKRLRPAFCYWGYVAAAGKPADEGPLLVVASSLELLHASALVHDDLIDDADTRRGCPAAHKRFEEHHGRLRGRGDAAAFGRSAAIILGDLLLMWSIELAESSGCPTLDAARSLLNVMRSEVTAGQYLDLAAQHGVTGTTSPADEVDVAQRVLEFKSARYSVRRPLQIGAALAGADTHLQAALSEFGSLTGQAFQLRDDLLGCFGDPALTGKPYGGDLREGKRTMLVLKALASDERIAARLNQLLGAHDLSEAEVEQAAGLIESSGARRDVERLIDDYAGRALAVLESAPMTGQGRAALAELVHRSVRRDR